MKTLLKMKFAICMLFVATMALPAYAQTPLPEPGEMVDLFTGDMKYNIPLFRVPVPNSPGYPISVSYRSGVRVDQSASWIGLGWDLEGGEISRQVKGVPDDWNGQQLIVNSWELADVASYSADNFIYDWENEGRSNESFHYYGPMYFKNFFTTNHPNNAMDLYHSERGFVMTAFEYPDYDKYYVKGAMLSGELQPALFDYANLMYKNKYTGNVSLPIPDNVDPYTAPGTNFALQDKQVDVKAFSKTMQFHFTNAFPSQVQKPGHSDGFGNHPNWPTTTDYSGDYNPYTNQVVTARYVQYFTNAQINNMDPSQSSDPLMQRGFLDYRTVGNNPRRDPTQYDPFGIGAFQITNENGMVFHYSLPVYTSDEQHLTFPLDGNDDIDISKGKLQQFTKQSSYASAWKLTAITGPDYVDANNNQIVDQGDKGYWLAFHYGLWTEDYHTFSPAYGYHKDISIAAVPKNVIANTQHNDVYERTGSIAQQKKQLYYLTDIQSATHSAVFITDVREDEFGESTGAKVPSLRLLRVLLMHNDDLQNFDQNASMDLKGYTSTYVNEADVMHLGKFNTNALAVKLSTLKAVEFTQDYSLAKNYIRNRQTSFSTQTVNETIAGIQVLFQVATSTPTSSNPTQSGKLTLRSLKVLHNAYTPTAPPYQFEYSQVNPNYKADHKDFWGFYKSDFDVNEKGQYTTSSSAASVEAWSMKKITTPLGGEIIINYEPDQYQLVGYSPGIDGMVKPRRSFLIKSVQSTGINGNVGISFFDNDIFDLDLNNVYNTGAHLKPPNNQGFRYLFGREKDLSSHQSQTPSSVGHQKNCLNISSFNKTSQTMSITCVEPGNRNVPGIEVKYVTMEMNEVFGGGVRVKQIEVREPETQETYYLNYTYKEGVATTEPDRLTNPMGNEPIRNSGYGSERHALGPQVSYTQVEVSQTGELGQAYGSSLYRFHNYEERFEKVFDEVQDTRVDYWPCFQGNGKYVTDIYYRLRVEDRVSALYGNLAWLKKRDAFDNTIYQVTNRYLDVYNSLDKPRMGKIEEIFYSHKKVRQNLSGCIPSAIDPHFRVRSTYHRIRWSTALKEQLIEKDGLVTRHVYTYDGETGLVKGAERVDPTGQTYFSDKTFAFREPGNADMGMKSLDPSHKNILSVVASEMIFEENANGPLLNGTNTSWSDVMPVRSFSGSVYFTSYLYDHWRPVETRVYNGESDENDWKLVEENTLFNAYNNVLESRAVNGRYASVKYGYDNLYAIAEVKNCDYASFAYAGFESTIDHNGVKHFDGEVFGGANQAASFNAVKAHTGNQMLRLAANDQVMLFNSFYTTHQGIETGLHLNRTYVASIWVHDSNTDADPWLNTIFKIQGSGTKNKTVTADLNESIQVGNWRLLKIYLEVPEDQSITDLKVFVENNGSGVIYFDDFKFHPTDALISALVYDEQTGRITHSLDNEHFYTRFEYDAAGRKIKTYKETLDGEKLVESKSYNYAQ